MPSRSVKVTSTHQVVHVPGVGQFSNTLNRDELSRNETAKGNAPCLMHQTEHGVEVKYKGKHFLIPWGNISSLVFDSELESKSKD